MSKVDTLATITEYLDANGCRYEMLEHEPYTSSEEATHITGVSPEFAAKSLLYKTLGGYILTVLPASERVNSGKLRKLLSTRDLRMATPIELDEVMGCQPGTCHPLGVLSGVRTLVDVSLTHLEDIGFSTGDPRHTIVMPFDEYDRIAAAELVDVSVTN